MISITFLVSGEGGNLKFFNEATKRSLINSLNISVIADRDCGALKYADDESLPSKLIHYDKKNSSELLESLQFFQPDIIITNWNKIIGTDVLSFPGNFLNLHYSLLPAFPALIGSQPIKQAYEKGCKYIGPTCHSVVEEVDAGPILSQHAFKTPISQQEAVGAMFKAGCLVLLSGIEISLNKVLINESSESKPSSYIEHKLKNFTEEFWETVGNI